MEVLAAADMLQVKQLKQACINYLDEELSCENACTVLRACRQLELPQLATKCAALILKNAEAVFKSSTIGHCPKEDLLTLLQDETMVAGEEDVFNGVMQWGEMNKSEGEGSSIADTVADNRRSRLWSIRFWMRQCEHRAFCPKTTWWMCC